ncbi:MAG: chemotaxis protein CheW [Thiobacillus sp.]|nr:chemotaxis protein CheW [Thiobacillus sp.]
MSKKFNLRDFQTRLSQQLQAAAGRDTSGSRLGFRVGDANWLVSLTDTEEVLPVPPIVRVPGARRWFRGLANIRGNLYAVSDFSDFMGQGATPEHNECRLLIPHRDFGVNAALLVRGTLGLRNIGRYRPLDAVAPSPWVSRQYTDESGANWHDLDFSRLLATPEFLRVEAQA